MCVCVCTCLFVRVMSVLSAHICTMLIVNMTVVSACVVTMNYVSEAHKQ